jgi:hypothetical protein
MFKVKHKKVHTINIFYKNYVKMPLKISTKLFKDLYTYIKRKK